ncbi:hypothetical protein HYDPIDRAFT_100234 [Hydnomerulius pinastri MD-312]|uniref:Protein kinase domain-containing protein n=1 Tax=Hydnomerulius pinastri MD-312 TaxID=994086 RepID=A0A0C9V371_9AGAM|nr:hypothetical protein HYDPIDRAFT_100234 [Hydnomerulius pinastri MD-312]
MVGRGLTTFTCTKELAQGVLDAVEAHWQIYEQAKILHRDISAGNIMLADEGRGVLVDWDLSNSRDHPTTRRERAVSPSLKDS